MINRIRYIWQLLVIASVLALLGILVIPRMDVGITLNVYLITLGSSVMINLVSYLLMFEGIGKNSKEGMLMLLAGIGLNFLLYLLFILLFWVLTKNLSKPFIILFFTLYLLLAFFATGHLLKFLKNK